MFLIVSTFILRNYLSEKIKQKKANKLKKRKSFRNAIIITAMNGKIMEWYMYGEISAK